ncbi:hypothetical protein ABZ814_13485 [Micromonospora musae]|uniref:hypothetical protein n=1 Tax=Micromonospora musae TaxID=1894970 RepID=UPI003407E192
MARLLGPAEDERVFYYDSGPQRGRIVPVGTRVPLYADEACSQPADVLAADGSVLPTSGGIPYVVTGPTLQAGRFLMPDAEDPVVYTRLAASGPVVTLHPASDSRLDSFRGVLDEYDVRITEAQGVAAPAAAQANRRNGFGDRALLGAGGWVVKRRNVDEYRLMRDLGDGFVADHQLTRGVFPISNVGPAAGPNSEPRPMLLNDVGIGIPMLPVTFDAASYTGTGWATVAGYFGGQIAPLGLGLDAVSPTVSTTAGSTTITITSSALTPALRYNTRRVVIPGAGAAGADLVTAVGAMNANGLSFTVGTAPSASLTGVTATIYPGRRSTLTAAAAASYTAPLGATSVGIVVGMGGNGGFSSVAVDDDLTRATWLPTAQDLVDQGIAPSSMLTTGGGTVLPTTRILDSYNLIELWSVWQALASGLDPAVQHTVAVTVTGYKRNASSSTRLIVGGWGYGTATTGPLTANALPFIAIRCGKSTPVHELAVDHQPAGTSSHTFVGGHNHGYEYETQALTLVVDGASVTLTDGQAVAVAGSATLVRRSDLYHPQNTATATLRARTSYRLDRTGLVVNTLIEAVVATVVDSAYFGSFTAPHSLGRLQVDKDLTVYDLRNATLYPEGTYIGTGRNTSAVWWEPSGQAVAVLLVPTAEAQTGGWDGSVYASVRNFPSTSQSSKWYARRTGSLAAGGRWTGEVTYVIGRLPDGASAYFPVS